MAVNYIAALKTNRLRTVADAIDAKTFVVGSGTGAAGKLVIGTSALNGTTVPTAVISTHALSLPCGTASGTALTFTLPTAVNATNAGTVTAALAEIRTSADALIVTGLTVTVTGGGGDVQLNSLSVTNGQSVNITAMAINHP